ncbi:hypothetical protein CEP51_007976 [Fusarium floridanum]|uniref:Uncharacterized protein n=1 Tax=Fusarium floridanum TaxID=1325733 RepID=A0A428RMC1_9HYPO|nr:hypothetical protein CEP51_007976 [Fusarium floridanum]
MSTSAVSPFQGHGAFIRGFRALKSSEWFKKSVAVDDQHVQVHIVSSKVKLRGIVIYHLKNCCLDSGNL